MAATGSAPSPLRSGFWRSAPRADTAQQRVAWTVLANTWFDGGRFADAERAFRELDARIPPGDPERAEVRERLAASVYRQAEARQAAGDIEGAVGEFLRVATLVPDSTIRAKAEFDAATLLLNAKQWDRAAQVLEAFRSAHPQHELAPEATRKLAVAYLESGRTQQAAIELERVATLDGEDGEIRRTALWQAAELYAGANDRAAATRAYTSYVERYPAPHAAAIDARQALADLARDTGDTAARRRWLEEVIAADAAAGSRAPIAAAILPPRALSSLRGRTTISRARSSSPYRSINRCWRRRPQPSRRWPAIRAQRSTVSPRSTTAAGWAMADLYRDLGKSLLDSERPPSLSQEEREAYDVLLEEQAFPFEEKAIEIHETNARRAADGVYDQWVRKSYASLAELKPARYARSELDPDSATAPVSDPAAAGAENPVPPEIAAQLEVARASLAAGRDEDAVGELNSALTQYSASAEGFNRLGIAYRRLGRMAEARAAYERRDQRGSGDAGAASQSRRAPRSLPRATRPRPRSLRAVPAARWWCGHASGRVARGAACPHEASPTNRGCTAMSAIRHSGTASRTIVWLLVVAAFALGTAYAAEPGAVADPVAPGDTPAGSADPGQGARIAGRRRTHPAIGSSTA